MVLGNFKRWGVFLIWIIVEQRPTCTMLALVVWIVFLSPISLFFLSLSLSLGDGSIETEILSERVIKPKTPNKLYRRVYRTLGYDKLTPVELEPSINI